MRGVSAFIAVIVFGLIASLQAKGQSQGTETNESLNELKEKIKVLESMIEGTAHPMNLARTSLAKVDASSVNGARMLNDVYYGIQNAFDDGQHWFADINYTYWLSSSETMPWIEIQFNYPVTITSVFVEQAPAFSTTFYFSQGGQTNFKAVKEQLTLESPTSGVNRVRLSFNKEDKNIISVSEVKILGYPPFNVEFNEGLPDLVVSDLKVLAQYEQRANKIFDDWKRTLLASDHLPRREETEDSIMFIFGKGNEIDFLRVTIDKETHLETIEELVQLITVDPKVIEPTVTVR